VELWCYRGVLSLYREKVAFRARVEDVPGDFAAVSISSRAPIRSHLAYEREPGTPQPTTPNEATGVACLGQNDPFLGVGCTLIQRVNETQTAIHPLH
jgi:hypothetical protein